jgi:hypothetical protein
MGREIMRIKIIKVPMGNMLDTKTTAFKIVDLNNKDIIDLDVGNMFYWKKRDAIKYKKISFNRFKNTLHRKC